MKKSYLVVLISLSVVLALSFWLSRHPAFTWRVAVLEMKLTGRLEALSWAELIAGMQDTDPLEFGSTTTFTGLKGSTSGLVSLNRLEATGPCPALWNTPVGQIWGRFSDETSLEALFIEQLLLQIYQNDLVGVNQGDIVLDVGSHLGTFTKLALQKGAGLVLAFEPDPTNINCFKRTFQKEIEENRVILKEAAVWDEQGTISFSSSDESGAAIANVATGGDLDVAAVRIDDVVEELGLERVDFIKMDIEGAERRALAGATQVLAQFGPRLALSIYHEPDDPQVIPEIVLQARPNYQVVPTIAFAYFFEDRGVNHAGTSLNRSIVGLKRNGEIEEIPGDSADYSFPRFSPDGTRLAMVAGGNSRDLWLYSFSDGKRTRLTSVTGLNWSPVWSPDGSQIVFSAMRGDGNLNIFRTTTDGCGEEERLTESKVPQIVESWSSDGKTLAFSQLDARNGSDIWVMSLESGGKEEPFLSTPYFEGWPRFSPDGGWLAYTSNENGYLSVYVCSFPGPGGKQQISTREGWYPRWGSDGKELFYRVGSQVMAVPVRIDGKVLEAGTPRELFRGEYALGFQLEGGAWDVSSDGERLLMLRDRVDKISLDTVSKMR